MKAFYILALIILPGFLFAQQVADTTYNPSIQNPQYKTGQGSVVFIDEGHHNFHTKEGRYKAFSNLLERDGYQVLRYSGLFNLKELSKGKILVIANALNALNVENWYVPNPSAFTPAEIEVVRQWVKSGGSLFLIADHMPMAGAASDLAKSFGFEFTNGFVFDSLSNGTTYFNYDKGTLLESVITKGSGSTERVQQVVSFTGQAFRIPEDAGGILKFSKGYVNLLPDTAWVFNDKTTRLNAEGWYQGAYKKYAKGRVVVFGEAAMFTAQLAGPQRTKMGMNNPAAPENYQLLLNIIHWLDGKRD